jgi:hypothetical protein
LIRDHDVVMSERGLDAGEHNELGGYQAGICTVWTCVMVDGTNANANGSQETDSEAEVFMVV